MSDRKGHTTLLSEPGAVSGPPSPNRSLIGCMGRRDAVRRRMLLGADVTSSFVAISLAGLVAGGELLVPLAGIAVWLVLAKLYGLYDRDHRVLRHLTVDELSTLAAWISTSAATHTLLLTTLEPGYVGIGWGLSVWLTMLVLAPVTRAGARAVWRRFTAPEPAVIVGSGLLEAATHRKLELFGDIHVTCVGVLHETEVRSIELLEARLDDTDAARVIIASDRLTEQLIADHLRVCRRRGLKLSIIPPTRGLFGTAVQLHHVADLPMINYSTSSRRRSGPRLKRIMDASVAAAGLILLSPLLVAVALAVKLTSGGPAVFRQTRAGLDGAPFGIFKFRTMDVDAEIRLREVVDVDALDDPMFKLRSDPRVTPLGRWLRRTSLDELPQLLNVLRGEMSLVGPRPEQLDLVQRYRPEHRVRLTVKPGLTGPMQVYGRARLDFEERLAVEREYIENLSLARDLRILLLTLAAVFRSNGAY